MPGGCFHAGCDRRDNHLPLWGNPDGPASRYHSYDRKDKVRPVLISEVACYRTDGASGRPGSLPWHRAYVYA